ncbi:MAG: ATP-binding protein [Caulobacteraceae bacterium]
MIKTYSISEEYEKIREKNKNELESHKSLLYSKIPRLKDIDEEMVKLSIDITKTILSKPSNGEELIKELQKRQLDLKIEKAELLASNNYPKDYLDMKYQCKSCKDTGFIGNIKCSCYIQKEINYLYKQSSLADVLEKENFEQFRWEYYSDKALDNNISPKENMKIIYFKCINFVKDFDEHNMNLLFIGKPGLGKTFLCNSIAKDLLDKGKSVIYKTASDLIDIIRKYKFDFENEESNEQSLNEIYECDLLIIDDLGTELSTQFSNLALYSILNKRALKNKKMIISTNLDIDEFTKIYSDRITSRIFGSFDTLEFLGEDIRLKMHKII